MDFVLKGRGGLHITDHIRDAAEHKLGKISRLDPRVQRIEVEVAEERNPKIDGTHTVDVACHSSRHVFRAEGAGHGIDAALDQAVAHLERQITSYRGKLRDRRQAGAPG